ncbi:hypothetical protein MBO12_00690 [Candidatus Saccharibacteria bacterium]|nr:hypothetical protein [Candidatus Saccharibacteria bacterium]
MTTKLKTPAVAWEGISFSFETPDELSDLMFEGFVPEPISIETHNDTEDGALGARFVAAVEDSRFTIELFADIPDFYDLLKFIRVNVEDLGKVDFEDGILTLKDNKIDLC